MPEFPGEIGPEGHPCWSNGSSDAFATSRIVQLLADLPGFTPAPTGPGDVADVAEARLVILGPTSPHTPRSDDSRALVGTDHGRGHRDSSYQPRRFPGRRGPHRERERSDPPIPVSRLRREVEAGACSLRRPIGKQFAEPWLESAVDRPILSKLPTRKPRLHHAHRRWVLGSPGRYPRRPGRQRDQHHRDGWRWGHTDANFRGEQVRLRHSGCHSAPVWGPSPGLAICDGLHSCPGGRTLDVPT